MQGEDNALRLIGKPSLLSSFFLSLADESSCLGCSWVDILNHSSNLYFIWTPEFVQPSNTDYLSVGGCVIHFFFRKVFASL